MAGTVGRRTFTEKDKARVIAALAANGDNVKRTARETGVPPASIRRWRAEWQRQDQKAPSQALVAQAVTVFVDDAERVRNLALETLEQKILDGDIKASELITTLGVLDDKITRAKGLPTSRTENTSTLPDAAQLGELMAGFVSGAIAAAERRHDELVEDEVIVDAEVVELGALPAPSIAE